MLADTIMHSRSRLLWVGTQRSPTPAFNRPNVFLQSTIHSLSVRVGSGEQLTAMGPATNGTYMLPRRDTKRSSVTWIVKFTLSAA